MIHKVNMHGTDQASRDRAAGPDALDSRDFYEVCQQYRHDPIGVAGFECLKAWIRANATVRERSLNPEYLDE